MTEFQLAEHINGDWGVITSVNLRTIKVRDLKRVEAARNEHGDLAASVALVAAVTGLSVDQVEEMGAVDFTAVSEKLADFLPKASP